jgi:uncharacterized delta-60 repeat protein
LKISAGSLLFVALIALVGLSAGSAGAATAAKKAKIKSFSPTSGPPGTSVKIKGSNLASVTAVRFNFTPAQSFTISSDKQITAVVAAGSVSGKISVTTPGGTTTSSGTFTVNAPPGPPKTTITSFAPTISAPGAPVVITGTGFNSAGQVSFDDTPALSYTIISDTQIRAWLAPGTTSGRISVTSALGTGTSATPLTVAFLIDPSTCQRQPGTIVGVLADTPIWFGTGWLMSNSSFLSQFLSNTKTTLTLNGKSVKSADSFWDPTGLPGPGGAASGWLTRFNYDPRITIASGGKVTASFQVGVTKTLNDGFGNTYAAGTNLWPSNPCNIVGMPLATFSSFSPTSGRVGTPVTITGKNLTWITGIKFGEVDAPVTHVNDTTLTTQVPAGAHTAPIRLAQGTQATISGPSEFTVDLTAPLTISSVTPAKGAVESMVTLAGSGLIRVKSISFGGTPADRPFVHRGDNELIAWIPPGAHTGSIVVSDGVDTASTPFTVIESQGGLDASFGDNGVAVVDINPFYGPDRASAVTVDQNGKIVAAGMSRDPYDPQDLGPVVMRLNDDGSLDTTFGSNGIVNSDLPAEPEFHVVGVTVQADGKIVVGGASGDRFVLVRYLSSGSLDTGFGTDGVVATAWLSQYTSGDECSALANAMAVDSTGDIVVGGSACGSLAVARYNPDGSLDPSFGVGGQMIVSLLMPSDWGNTLARLALQRNGKIVLAGGAYDGVNVVPVVVRLNPDGSSDATFGTNGRVYRDGSDVRAWSAVAVTPTGAVLLAGISFQGYVVSRLRSNGALDGAFGTAGFTLYPPSGANKILIDSEGRVLVVSDREVHRFSADGVLDPAFGVGGLAEHAWWVDATFDGDGRVITAGQWASQGDGFAVGRYSMDERIVP